MIAPGVRHMVQISDLHIGETRDHRLAGICTYDSFSKILADIAARRDYADIMMVTGDVAAEGKHSAYRLFSEQTQFFEIPYAWLPGNHDDFAVMQSGFISSPYWPLLELGAWRVLSLNTAIPGEVGGRLVEEELMFLEQSLRAESESPFVIFMHHPPMPVGCEWLDKQRIANADEFEGIVRAAGNVKALFTGHVHQELESKWAGCDVYTTPSTCFQFAASSDGFAMSDGMPGYRWIDLHPDGQLTTGVRHLSDIEHQVDHAVAGY